MRMTKERCVERAASRPRLEYATRHWGAGGGVAIIL
jgi:hypothetical protein